MGSGSEHDAQGTVTAAFTVKEGNADGAVVAGRVAQSITPVADEEKFFFKGFPAVLKITGSAPIGLIKERRLNFQLSIGGADLSAG